MYKKILYQLRISILLVGLGKILVVIAVITTKKKINFKELFQTKEKH